LLAAIIGAVSLAGIIPQSNAVVTAHRGASMAAPENTLAAVQRAIEQGADWVEIDVQETADGRVVVLHDRDLRRVAGVDLWIADATYEQLGSIDIGSWFAPQYADQRVPTLEQVLEMCRGRAGVNIELKFYGREERLEERVIDIVESMGMESEIVLMSLKHDSVRKLKELKELRPNWTIGLLTAVAIGDLTRVEADFLAVNTGLATPAFIRAAHRAGKEVQVWTINDPVTSFALISRGADAIITDRPAMVRRSLQTHAGMTAVERFVADVAILIGAIQIDDDEPEEIG
jgi:glycerophosphoryl diester phosphodiesterase